MNIKNIFDLIEAITAEKTKRLLSLVLVLFYGALLKSCLPPMILSFTDATGLGLVESSIGLAFSLALSYHFDYRTGFKETLK